MILLTPARHDDEQFVETVQRVATAVVNGYRPLEVYVIHVDNWFDHIWNKFSGVVDLQLGTWAGPSLRVPPFNPNRILGQIHFRLNQLGEPIHQEHCGAALHIRQYSISNLQRRLNEMTQSGLFVWYSGSTRHNHRGSLMVYIIQERSEVSWYASFSKKEEWLIDEVEGISRRELTHLMQASISPATPEDRPTTLGS